MSKSAPYHWRFDPNESVSWRRYAEPYFTDGAWLFQQDPKGITEVVNDVDGVLQNFRRVMESRKLRLAFDECLDAADDDEQLVVWAGHELQKWYLRTSNRSSAKAAAALFILNRPQATVTVVRRHLERYDHWLFDLAAFRQRISGITVRNEDPLKFIEREDSSQTFFLIDPPRIPENNWRRERPHEMDEQGHKKLIELVGGLKGLAAIRHCPSDLYDDLARRHIVFTTVFHDLEPTISEHGKELAIDQVWYKNVSAEWPCPGSLLN